MVEYSERHHIPTVQGYREIEAQRKAEAAKQASSQQAPSVPPKDDGSSGGGGGGGAAGGGQAEKERIKAQMAPKEKPAAGFQAQGERLVDDPTTGGKVKIADDTKNAQTDPLKLDSRYEGGYSHNKASEGADHGTEAVAPNPAEPGNILLQQFPPAVQLESIKKLNAKFQSLAVALGVAMAIAWFFTAFGAGYWRFIIRTSILGGIGIGGWMALGLEARKIEQDFEDVRMHMHKQRGEEHSPPMPESVEWLNAMISVVWKQINPEMFIPMVDQIEDVMQQSLPGIVDAVKISDVGHGTNPFRFVSMRGLADVMEDKNYPRDKWVSQGKSVEDDSLPKDGSEKKAAAADDADGDGIKDEDESGDYLCYEVSFSYGAEPGKKSKNDYIHLMLTFFLGNDLLKLPFNVNAQIKQISGTLRLRMQMVQNPPYIRLLTFSLMGVPNVEVSVIPLSRALPNVLDLPLISGFVKSSIAAAANEYVAPKSMTMNMAQMLSGDGVKKDTDAVGVLCVQLQRAEGLSAQDTNGFSDPYIVLSFAKFGRPLYSSRIIFEDLDPSFNETAFLLVTKDDLKADEELSIQLWDSDKRTADDIVGRVTRKLSSLCNGNTTNKFVEQVDALSGFEEADEMPGKMYTRIGYFTKAKLNRALIKSEEEKKGDTELQKEDNERKGTAVDSNEEADALRCPPDPKWPCGILSIFVDHIEGLENRDVEKGVKGKEREGTQGQDVSASGETPDNLPSGYVEFVVNDEIIYKTRVKPLTNLPWYNAGTEVFIRNAATAQVRIVVRDSRMREHDPIMGIVDLKVSDLFKEASQTSGLYSLSDGVGYGKVSASFVFKAVTLDLPKELLGWDTATVELQSKITTEGIDPLWSDKLKGLKITVTTGDDTQKLMPAEKQPDINPEEETETLARLPVYDRYSSQLAFSFGGGVLGKREAAAVVSLCDIIDDKVTDIEIPVYTGQRLGTLVRSHIDDHFLSKHDYKKVGTLRVKITVSPGLDEDHERLATGQADRHAFETYDRAEGQAKVAEINSHADDDGVIDKDEKKRIEKAKTKALHSRQRGSYGYAPVRGAVWSKDNAKSRVRSLKDKITGNKPRDQTVKSEV